MSRRDALKYAAATPALIGLVSAAESLRAPSAAADGVGVDINNICKPQFGQWA